MYYSPEKLAELMATYPDPQDPKSFEAVAVNCVHTSWRDVSKYTGTTSELLNTLEDRVLLRINDHRPDDNVGVSVTAQVGAVQTEYVVKVYNHTLDLEYTVTVNEHHESIDPAPTTKSMGKRSNLAIDVTVLVRDLLASLYIDAEPISILNAPRVIYDGIHPKLEALLDKDHSDWELEVSVDQFLTAEVIVDIPGVTKVRLRATRKPENLQEEKVNA